MSKFKTKNLNRMAFIPRQQEKHCFIACSEDKVNKGLCDCINGIRNEALSQPLVSGMLPDEVPNLFVTLAQQIHYESVINGLDMTSIIECFNELQEAYKKERSNYR